MIRTGKPVVSELPDADDPYQWETLRQARSRTGLGYSTIRGKIRTGELAAFHAGAGRKLYVRIVDVNRLMVPVQLNEKD